MRRQTLELCTRTNAVVAADAAKGLAALTADVRHVHHEQRAVVVRDLPEALVVPLARVRGPAADDHRYERGGIGCRREGGKLGGGNCSVTAIA